MVKLISNKVLSAASPMVLKCVFPSMASSMHRFIIPTRHMLDTTPCELLTPPEIVTIINKFSDILSNLENYHLLYPILITKSHLKRNLVTIEDLIKLEC